MNKVTFCFEKEIIDKNFLHLFVLEDGNSEHKLLNALNSQSLQPFQIKKGKFSRIFIHEGSTVAILGVKKNTIDADVIELGGKICSWLKCVKYESLVLHNSNLNTKKLAQGFLLKSISFKKYISKKENDDEQNLHLQIISQNPKIDNAEFVESSNEVESVNIARNLVNEPANVLYPEYYAEEILKKLDNIGLNIDVFDESYLQTKSMNAMLGVAQGSATPPRLVSIEWNGTEDKNKPPIIFVGKGVTFDTGGISLKPAKGMWEMKSDMAGSAALVGLMHSLAKRKAKTRVISLLGIVENGIGANAQRPGDIVRSMSGQTIEVLNTDAEGRLVLADVVTYAENTFSPAIIIDIATLTGAIVVALGEEYAGLFSNNSDLAKKLIEAGEKSGEKLWEFPLSEAYDKSIDSTIADMKNISTAGSGADSITAAQFIKRFVKKESTLWAHLDIAGVAYKGSAGVLHEIGSTGFGVRLLNEFIRSYE